MNLDISSQFNQAVNTDYGQVLEQLGISAALDDQHYYQVGTLEILQGWIIYVSVVRSQLEIAIRVVAPILSAASIPFKIIQNRETARLVLDGDIGYAHVGKVICAYPKDEDRAIQIVIKLIEILKQFDGPVIPSAAYLGTQVYCRYGAHKGIMATMSNGYLARHIKHANGRLVPDASGVPFLLPDGVEWPFNDVTQLKANPNSGFHPGYRIVQVLRENARGNVMVVALSGRADNGQFYVAKEARPHLWSDDYGRDMRDRLRWQARVHKELAGRHPLPKFQDYFEWGGSEYFIMEFVNGVSSFEATGRINSRMTWWPLLENDKKIWIINTLLKITSALRGLHKEGYVHRDVTPVNFLITDAGDMKMIDIEMSVNFAENTPNPPFELGTDGFMSPQQEQRHPPCKEDDLYGLGATILSLVTLHAPYRLGISDGHGFRKQLNFLIGYGPLEDIVNELLNTTPANRPSLQRVQEVLFEYRQWIGNGTAIHQSLIELSGLRDFIQSGINGLVSDKVPSRDQLWYFPASTDWAPGNPSVYTNAMYGDGVAGILYTLEVLRKSGYDITLCQSYLERGYNFLWEAAISHWQSFSGGYVTGAGGIAVALAERQQKDAPKAADETIQFLLSMETTTLDVKTGLAGRGLAIQECYPEGGDFAKKQLAIIEKEILNKRIDQGVWITLANGRANLDFFTGNSGVLFFLLRQWDGSYNCGAYRAIRYGKDTTIEEIKHIISQMKSIGYAALFTKEVFEGFLGGVKVILEYYRRFKEPEDEKLIRDCLALPDYSIIFNNPSLQNGMAGLGMLYIEAHKLLRKNEYLKRAEWIGAFLINSCMQGEEEATWRTGNMKWANPSLLGGSCGMLLFLELLRDTKRAADPFKE